MTVLEDHKSELLQRLTEIEPVKEVEPVMQVGLLSLKYALFDDGNVLRAEITSQLSPVLKGRSELKEHKMRLLGQLAVIAFKSTDDCTSIGFLNYAFC